MVVNYPIVKVDIVISVMKNNMKISKEIDKNGVPLKIEIPVYYTIYDENKILYDEEEMRLELANVLDNLPAYTKII